MTIEITEEERDLLLGSLRVTNYPGEIAELVAGLKAKLAPPEKQDEDVQ